MNLSMSSSHAAEFEPHRAYLRGLAYRMLGSLADAEDIVQEAYLRWQARSLTDVRVPRAYLAKLVTRLCLDQLKSARARREAYVGPWLPEPVLDTRQVTTEDMGELAHDISIALLLTLERLSPLERAAFLLHDVFDYEHGEVSEMLGREPAACRKLVQRAREQVRSRRPRYRPSHEESARVLAAFTAAVSGGDLDQLGQLLVEDAVVLSDGGGRVQTALKPILGRERVAKYLVGVARKFWHPEQSLRFVEINGLPGYLIEQAGRTIQSVAFELSGTRVAAIYTLKNPDKLQQLLAQQSC